MKNLVISFILIFFACTWAYAQETPIKRTEEYCELRTKNPLFSSKLVAQVDFGKGEEVLKDEHGKPIDFASAVGALNYMNSKGWELMNVHVWVSDGEGYTYYVMKRKIQ